jgi:hypothetical protein
MTAPQFYRNTLYSGAGSPQSEPMDTRTEGEASTAERARAYIDLGIQPTPLRYQTKEAYLNGWPQLRITHETVPEYFGGEPQNIGGVMGTMSGGIVDLDFDWPEAAESWRAHPAANLDLRARAANPAYARPSPRGEDPPSRRPSSLNRRTEVSSRHRAPFRRDASHAPWQHPSGRAASGMADGAGGVPNC